MIGNSPPCTVSRVSHAMRQERLFIVAPVSLFTTLSLSPLTEAQTVLGHPYKANSCHKLTCESGQQCAWYVRQGPCPGPALTMTMVYLSRLARPARPWRGSTYLDCPILLTCPTHIHPSPPTHLTPSHTPPLPHTPPPLPPYTSTPSSTQQCQLPYTYFREGVRSLVDCLSAEGLPIYTVPPCSL